MSSPVADEENCPAAEQLSQLVQRVLADPDMTKSVASHVRWVEGTLQRALKEREDFRKQYGASLEKLLGPGANALCHLTDNGELRAKELDTPPKGVTASQRRRSNILRRLAAAAGVPSGAVSYPKPVPKPTMPAWARSEFHNRLQSEVDKKPSAPGRARLLVVIGLVLDTAARSGELCSLGITSLAPDFSWVKITRNPQAITSEVHTTEVWPVSSATQAALANWLGVRDRLVEDLEGDKSALLVVLHGNRMFHGQGAYKRGMPLQVRGLISSYRAGVQELKDEVTNRGGAGWQLPKGIEQLRRGVEERRTAYGTDRRAGTRTPKWAPAVVLNPLSPEETEKKKTATAFAKTAEAVTAFHQAREATSGDESDPQVLRARRTLQETTRMAWARSDHTATLRLLRQAGLHADDLAAAGYTKLLLDALERS
ncbi:hypothetical protein [Streptomyces rubradiris]|uniref:Tyr recombinase domain-containing protein n=1 Tax=Streptomyces rubradiris TaxID=285531 RepID=A0ABQ3RA90_STRRR|nr:hypothetical protein [Streptomyces rubradiris]GHH25857.1 hypothetical protein GCM10018792_65530 [Streptomyces rubradiris]GHI52758.1 hypothetical protein Srubr_26040 [Streptomyces rubradiris]